MFSEPGWLNDFLRTIFTGLDNVGYFFVEGIFNVFFTIVNADLFSGSLINQFYTRIQMILGILMIFRISITLLQMIVNPDMFKDKQKGAGSLVKRVAVMLVLLTLIVPIEGISEHDPNDLNQQIRSNGILFGFLYQFQNSVIQDNVLGKLILGSNVDSIPEGESSDIGNMSDVGAVMSSTVAKAFIKPTLKSDAPDEINTQEDYQANIACPGEEGGDVGARPYFSENLLRASTLVNHVNDTCQSDGEEVYVFDYTILGGLVSSIIMTIIIIGFTLDIAVRAIKLAILRLIAPVPIISYISPGQEKDGAFGNWVKTLTSTYLSLFIRLAIIYFGAYLIIVISEGGFSIWQSSTSFATSLLASIFIIIGILVFMKQAPKFFQDMLGIKGDGKLFSGIGTMLGAAALTGGLFGSAIGSYRTGIDEARELGLSRGQAIKRGLIAGAGGVLGGAFVGGKALATSDKQVPSAVFAAMQKRNATRASGSTLVGRTKSRASALFMGSSLGARESTKAQLYAEAAKAARAHKQMLEEEAIKNNDVKGVLNYLDYQGNSFSLAANYQDFVGQFEAAKAAGKNTFNYVDSDGNNHIISTKSINANRLQDFKESQATVYATTEAARNNKKVQGTAQEATYAFNKVGLEIDPYLYTSGDPNNTTNVKRAIGEAMNAERDIKTNPELQYKIADDKATNNNNK